MKENKTSKAVCKAKPPKLTGEKLQTHFRELGENWQLIDGHHLEKEYKFKNFQEALNFTNNIGKIAEEEGHHPEIFLSWGLVRLKLWSHNLDGLSEFDFTLAAKFDTCYLSRKLK